MIKSLILIMICIIFISTPSKYGGTKYYKKIYIFFLNFFKFNYIERESRRALERFINSRTD